MKRAAALLALALTALAAAPAGANNLFLRDRCAGLQMSCADRSNWRSPISPRISLIADLPSAAPEACVKDILGMLVKSKIQLCEAFLAGKLGSPRQRAITWLNLGHAYRWSKDHMRPGLPSAAVQAWEKAIAEEPDYAEPYVAIANFWAWGNENLKAVPFFEQALKRDPRNWPAMLGLAKAFAYTGRMDDALALSGQALELAPDEGIAHQIRGLILEEAKRYDEAFAEYQKATVGYAENEPRRLPGVMQEPPPWNAISNLAGMLHMPGRAIAALDHLIESRAETAIEPNNLIFRGEQHEAAGFLLKAADDYARAVRLMGPGYRYAERYLSRSAMLRTSAGKSEEARETFRNILRTGKTQAILRIQVFLKNQGFDQIVIDGKLSAALEKALDHCLAKPDCSISMGQSI